MAGVTELVTWVDRHLMGLSMLTLNDVSSIMRDGRFDLPTNGIMHDGQFDRQQMEFEVNP